MPDDRAAAAWRTFDAAAAGRMIERRSVAELPSAAIAALEAGCDTPSLRILAGMSGAGWSEVDAVLARVWGERGIRVPTRAVAEKLFADNLLRSVVAGDCTPYAGAREMWTLSLDLAHLHEDDAHTLEGPEHSFDYLELTLQTVEEVEAETIEVARQILSRGGVRILEPVTRHPSLDDRIDPAVQVVAYKPEWAQRAVVEADAIRAALGHLPAQVEHIGSTAVPGLAGKPIIDLLVVVPSVSTPNKCVNALTGLGYLYAPDPESPKRLFLAKPHERPRTFHVHVCEHDTFEVKRHLAVRDYLRAHPEEVASYAEFKRELVDRAPGHRLKYIAGKAPYMKGLETRALAWAEQRPSRSLWARLGRRRG